MKIHNIVPMIVLVSIAAFIGGCEDNPGLTSTEISYSSVNLDHADMEAKPYIRVASDGKLKRIKELKYTICAQSKLIGELKRIRRCLEWELKENGITTACKGRPLNLDDCNILGDE